MPFWSGLSALVLCLLWTGCSPSAGQSTDEEKNPYFVEGRDLAAAHDYKRALRAFEKALEANPDSALAHYELGLLHEQHENDYVSAIYHYQRALRARPDAYPADNAKVRIASCKQELVKAELVAPVAQNMVRELERLKQENTQLRQQLESMQLALRDRGSENQPRPAERSRDREAPRQGTGRGQSPAPLPRGSSTRSHVVSRGETAFSIARSYGVSIHALRAANPSVNPSQLRTGQRLTIPAR